MLHYVTKLKGFHIIATDGDAGHVDDFLVDERLNLRHMVIDTSKWFGGESVLISAAAIQRIDSPNKRVHVTLTRDEIKASPSVDTAEIELIETLPPPII
jgi:hypothetical protein